MRDFIECLGQIQISGIDIVCFASILAVTDYKKYQEVRLRRLRHTWKKIFPSGGWSAGDIEASQSHEHVTRNAYVPHKLNSKMLKDSEIVEYVLTRLYCVVTLWHCL